MTPQTQVCSPTKWVAFINHYNQDKGGTPKKYAIIVMHLVNIPEVLGMLSTATTTTPKPQQSMVSPCKKIGPMKSS